MCIALLKFGPGLLFFSYRVDVANFLREINEGENKRNFSIFYAGPLRESPLENCARISFFRGKDLLILSELAIYLLISGRKRCYVL